MIVEEIEYIEPEAICENFDKPGLLWLDSAKTSDNLGRYSYLAIDPLNMYSASNDSIIDIHGTIYKQDPFKFLKKLLFLYKNENIPELPPFQTGVAGLFGYESHQHLENVEIPDGTAAEFPTIHFGLYDLCIAFDHTIKKAWIFSAGFTINNTEFNEDIARKRLEHAKELINIHQHQTNTYEACSDFSQHKTKEQYLEDVEKVIEYIKAGDIFEANISQLFSCTKAQSTSALNIYKHLRNKNPAPFAAFYNLGNNKSIISCSPERFIKVTDDTFVEARPIKGTMPRSANKDEDLELANQLLSSSKDIAENTMIVDLMRNDISRVCMPKTVNVPQLCGLESFEQVHHLVSVVQGELAPHKSCLDLLSACFPGGSITGAPKLRSMEIIYEIEKMQRGPYCGSIGFISFAGNMDLSILIRTVCQSDNKLFFRAGGAITADSCANTEYEETLVKAKAIKEALLNP